MSGQSFVEWDGSDGSLIVLIGIDPRLSSFLTTHIVHLKEQNVMFKHPHPETVVRRWTESGIHISAVVRDPADAEQTLYGTAVRGDDTLIGSYYPADPVRQSGWHVVLAHGEPYRVASEPDAVRVLTDTTQE